MGTGPPARARCSRCLGGERIKNSCTTLRWRKPNVNSMNELLNDPPPQVVSCKHHGSTKSRNDDKPGSNWRAGEAPLKQQNTYSHTYLTAITKQSKTLLWFQILSLQKATSLITLFFRWKLKKKKHAKTPSHQAIYKPTKPQPFWLFASRQTIIPLRHLRIPMVSILNQGDFLQRRGEVHTDGDSIRWVMGT